MKNSKNILIEKKTVNPWRFFTLKIMHEPYSGLCEMNNADRRNQPMYISNLCMYVCTYIHTFLKCYSLFVLIHLHDNYHHD